MQTSLDQKLAIYWDQYVPKNCLEIYSHFVLVNLLFNFKTVRLILYFSVGYVQQLMDKLKELQYGSVATVTGRYYAMDRDKRHERNKIAYEGLVQGIGEETTPDNLIKV